MPFDRVGLLLLLVMVDPSFGTTTDGVFRCPKLLGVWNRCVRCPVCGWADTPAFTHDRQPHTTKTHPLDPVP